MTQQELELIVRKAPKKTKRRLYAILAYDLFQKLASKATNQEEIGFYFRQMSEKETPKLIVAKETAFRTWFNEESGNKIELKNPIKTWDRIKGQPQKYLFYDLMKEKNSVKTTIEQHIRYKKVT